MSNDPLLVSRYTCPGMVIRRRWIRASGVSRHPTASVSRTDSGSGSQGYLPKTGGPTETYNFALLDDLPEGLYDYLWVRLNPSSY